jgi:NAD-dependent SIR2 family protein deacetylase
MKRKKYVRDSFTCSCGGFLRPSVVLFGESLREIEDETNFTNLRAVYSHM